MDLKELSSNIQDSNATDSELWKAYIEDYRESVVLLSDKSLIEKKDN